jgi:hypothetical protein
MLIRRATDADFRNLCSTAMRAFHDDPVMRWLYPDDDVYFQPHGAVFTGAMTNWLAHQQPWCTDDSASLRTNPPNRTGTSSSSPHIRIGSDKEWAHD